MPYVSKSFRAGWTATWPFRFALLFLAVLVLPYFAAAQQGTILGTVTDQSGAAVLNAEVNLLQLSTGTLRTFTTNDVATMCFLTSPLASTT